MIGKLYLVSGTDVYEVQRIDKRRYGTLVAGLAMPPVTHVTQRGPRQHGNTLVGTLLEPRAVDVGIMSATSSEDEHWQSRRELLGMLKRFDNLILRLEKNNGEKYDLNVVYAAGAEITSADSAGLYDYSVVVRLIAHDPIWRSAEQRSLVVGIPVSVDAGTFPWTFGISFGTSYLNSAIELAYAGTWPAYPQIDVRGPVTNAKILNDTTGELLFLNTTIPDGQVVRIDLSENVKTVTNITTGENWMEYLSSDSDLATWHLAPAPEVPNGLNVLRFIGLAGGQATAITLRWYDKFIGV